MAVDPNLFKISFLVGDIVSRRLDRQPLPILSREDNEALRRQLFKEITKLGQLHISERGAAYKNLTDRIAESMEQDEKSSPKKHIHINFEEPMPCREMIEATELPQEIRESAYEAPVPDLTNDILFELLAQACDIVRSRSSSSASSRSEWSDGSTITALSSISSDSTVILDNQTKTESKSTTVGYGPQSTKALIWLVVLYTWVLWMSGSLAGQAELLYEAIEAVRYACRSLAGNGLAVLDPVAEGYLAWRKSL